MYELFEGSMKVPAFIWSTPGSIELGCIEQVKNMASLPFVYHHVALNADGHQGFGMPIGGVIATTGVVIPSAVGVDIGCGMIAFNTRIPVSEMPLDRLKAILGLIRTKIPLGFEHNKTKCCSDILPRYAVASGTYPIVSAEFEAAQYQMGSLGGGNHFIEIQKGSDGNVWVMIHSGSRNLGKKVCDFYSAKAKELNIKWHSNIDPNAGLFFLPLDSREGKDYMEEMEFCVAFAYQNRQQMILRVMESFTEAHMYLHPQENSLLNIHHNFAAMENHFGRNVLVHRKGATKAYEGELGIIPGSQGTASYIVRGKGNILSFKSCSHGAGRAMSRTKAQATLSLADEQAALDGQGILHSIRGQNDLDEASGAYKDIADVMANQADLVDIVVELKPWAVIKGPGKKPRR